MMNQNLEKKNHYNILYSYYQDLLTEKQKEVFENYYFEDYSLSEISLALKVSRNAIWDLLKKVERNLDNYENKLHLYQKNINLNKQLDLLKKFGLFSEQEAGKATIYSSLDEKESADKFELDTKASLKEIQENIDMLADL